ncbi:MAG: hypothetical protein MJZ66_02860 [Bacteroidales bacterium]|nr:hypothetical protein [Bacteroidales bacterium]
MAQTNYIQVQRASGYSKEQAYAVKVNGGYLTHKKADESMLAIVKQHYAGTMVVESQIEEIREHLIEIAKTVNEAYPRCKPVKVEQIEKYDEWNIIYLKFGGSDAKLEFEPINPLLHTSWIATC